MLACPDADVQAVPAVYVEQRVPASELPQLRAGWRVVAVTEQAIGFSAEVPRSGQTCTAYVRVSLVNPRVRIDDARRGCELRATRRHEQKHVDAAKAELLAFERDVRTGSDIERAMRATVARLEAANAAIDTDIEYHRLEGECHGE